MSEKANDCQPAELPEGIPWRKTFDPDGSIRLRVDKLKMGYPRYEREDERCVDIVIPALPEE